MLKQGTEYSHVTCRWHPSTAGTAYQANQCRGWHYPEHTKSKKSTTLVQGRTPHIWLPHLWYLSGQQDAGKASISSNYSCDCEST